MKDKRPRADKNVCPTFFVALLVLHAATALGARAADGGKVDFNREVRPILAGKCFACHGPDEGARKAGLRLDVREFAVRPIKKTGNVAVVPGRAGESELIKRVTTTDEDDVMPPAKHGARLTAAQVKALRAWVDQGAEYAVHWAYVKPVRPALPVVKDGAWGVNEIDRFVLARLEKEGLAPGAAGDRYALVRRLSIDLTGLPPTIEEAEAFARDESPSAYEALVDRLLAKPAFGERWAQVWLDLARYADSQGYANDPDRTIWRWRDWLIQALNANVPFDRFTVEMLAGDLLPGAKAEQVIATGFHRNTLTNTEGGTQPEEFRSAAVVDRVNTTMQVWTATTIGCAQCHTHKYDPFTQKEYYGLYAIFNNCEDRNTADDAPTVEAARVGVETEAEVLRAKVARAKKKLDEETKRVDADRVMWEWTVDPKTLPKDVTEILAKAEKDRKKDQAEKLTAYYRSQASKEYKGLEADFKGLEQEYKKLTVTTPVLKEGKARETHVHLRGNYLAKGEKVSAGLPAALPAAPAGEPMNRLTLARWLVSAENPLTARVAVNRLWDELFGVGIVETTEDFGIQGEAPSHPELLDWLATEYVKNGWDTKRMIKTIVCSATYRQSSAVSEGLAKRDPMNRLLARGPRVRLSAEQVRDQALFAAGLLSQKMYGPPCQPPKPNFGLSAAFGGTTDWKADTGEERWRRGVYVKVRRNAPHPSMVTFDAPERTYCSLRRIRTNTPLQALVTLNDPCFVEAAQGLARRIVKEGGDATEARARFAFRVVLTRPPTGDEVGRIVKLFEETLAEYRKSPKPAEAMATKPRGAAAAGMDVSELAAWTVVSNVLLNLDETLAKR
jgi:mono/diheme cytochrome c family protein